jgi:hypothetical protein
MKVDYFSQSKIKTWRRCQKSYDYRYNQGLIRKASPVALLRGTTLHAMLEAQIKGTDWRAPLVEYKKVFDTLWGEEAEGYPTPEELESTIERYNKHWSCDGLDYGGRAEITIEAEFEGMKFKGIIDALPDDQHGRRWLDDHKTHKILPDEHTRFSDIQTVLYYWAMRENGQKCDGILWDYIRTKPPTPPELLRNGTLSKRKNIDCDADTYLAAIKANGLNEADYADMLSLTAKNTFFKRVYLPNPAEVLIQEVVGDFFITAKEIVDHPGDRFCRNMSRDCKSCTYYQVCSAEVRGLDSSFIKKQIYTLRKD